MNKYLGACAAAAVLAALTVPVPAGAAQRRQDPGIHKQVTSDEFSSQRRRYRRHRVVVVRPYWRPRYSSYYYGEPYYRPYGAYAYPYGGYYAPGPHVRVGPGGFRFGFW